MGRDWFTPNGLGFRPQPLYFENRESKECTIRPANDQQEGGPSGRERLEHCMASLSLVERSESSRPCPSFLREVDNFMSSRGNILAGQLSTPRSRAFISTSVLSSSPGNGQNKSTGVLHASKRFEHGRLHLQADTLGSLTATAEYKPLQALRVNGMVGTDGLGWIGCRATTKFGGSNRFQVGWWHEFQSLSKFTSPLDIAIDTTGCHAAVDLFPHRVMMAVEATTPTSTSSEPAFSYQIVTELNDAKDPPLLLGVHQSPTKSTLSLRGIRKDESLSWRVEMATKRDRIEANTFKAGLLFPINKVGTMAIEATPSQLTGEVVLQRHKNSSTKCSVTFGLDSRHARTMGIALNLDA